MADNGRWLYKDIPRPLRQLVRVEVFVSADRQVSTLHISEGGT
jgi:hypothetical protein